MVILIFSRLSQIKLTNLMKFYKQHIGSSGHVLSSKLLTIEDIQRVKLFITNFADVLAMPLPGRIPGFKMSDIHYRDPDISVTEIQMPDARLWYNVFFSYENLHFRCKMSSTGFEFSSPY